MSSWMLQLPPETLELVFVHLPRADLLAILTTSSFFHRLAARVLYHALVDIRPRPAVRLIKTLAQNDLYPLLVRRFDLEWTENILTANFFHTLHRTLQRLRRLSFLGLDFSASDSTTNLAWILQGCSFSLRVFATSIRCGPLLARFLETQPDLVEICLRGYHPSPSLPTASATSTSPPSRPEHAPCFPLAPGSLPRLRHFRAVLASPDLTADFVRGRPVESVSLSLYPGDAVPSLDALLLSTRPLQRLTVMSFDLGSPAALIAEIATRLPALEALHAVVLVRHATHGLFREVAASLSLFKALRYLTFMAPGAFESEESEVAAVWGRACPTLRSIVLPRGTVWGHVNGRWVSMEEEVCVKG